MRGSTRRHMLNGPVSQGSEVKATKERFPLAKRNGRYSEMNFIDVAGLNILPHSVDAAANFDILFTGSFARQLQRGIDSVGDEIERRTALHLDW